MKEQVTLNKENWSGGEITVEIDRDTGNFNLFDYEFHLEINEKDGYYILTGTGWSDPLFSGYLINGRWCVESYDICREDEDPYKAAIKLLCNII